MSKPIFLPKLLDTVSIALLTGKIINHEASLDEIRTYNKVMSSEMLKRTPCAREMQAWEIAGRTIEEDQALQKQLAIPDPGRIPEKNQHNRWSTHPYDGPDEL